MCNHHFGPEDYERFFMNHALPPNQQRWVLRAGVVPNRNLSGDPAIERRRERTRERLQKKEHKEIVKSLLDEEEEKAAKELAGYKAVYITDPKTNKQMITFARKAGPPVPVQELPSTSQPGSLPTQQGLGSLNNATPTPKLGNNTETDLKLQAAMERIAELEKEVKMLNKQKEMHANKVSELQMALTSVKRAKLKTQKMLWFTKNKWTKREKVMQVTEKKKLAYAKEFMYKHTCWSKRMIDAFLDDRMRTTWSPADIQLGLSIYSLSPRAYRFLTNFNLLPLPALTTMRAAKVFKRVGTETGIQLYQRTEDGQQQHMTDGDAPVNNIGSDDEDEETERRMNEEMAEADRMSSGDSDEEVEDKGDTIDCDENILDSSGNAINSTLDKPDTQPTSSAEQDFLASLMEEVVLPEHQKSMPTL